MGTRASDASANSAPPVWTLVCAIKSSEYSEESEQPELTVAVVAQPESEYPRVSLRYRDKDCENFRLWVSGNN